MEAGSGRPEDAPVLALQMEEGATSQGQPPEPGKGKKTDCPKSLWKECSPEKSSTVTSAQGDSAWTSDLQNRKRINLCCLKPLCLLSFVPATVEI